MNSVDYALYIYFFFFNDTATTEIYTLSLHDALPILFLISDLKQLLELQKPYIMNPYYIMNLFAMKPSRSLELLSFLDRKSTRLNSSHANISYAVFCLKKKKINIAN